MYTCSLIFYEKQSDGMVGQPGKSNDLCMKINSMKIPEQRQEQGSMRMLVYWNGGEIKLVKEVKKKEAHWTEIKK